MVTAMNWCVDDDLQAIIVWPPSFIDMIKSMRHPLLLKHFVSFLAYVERFTTPVGKRIKKEIQIVNRPSKCKTSLYNQHMILVQLFSQGKPAFLLVRDFWFCF